MAVAFAMISRHERGARTDISVVPLLQANRPSRASSPERVAHGGAVDAPGQRDSLVEDLTHARENANPSEREIMIEDLLTRLVEIDSQAAARFAEHVSEADLREVSLRVVAQRWAHIDAEAVTLWAAALADTTERDQAIVNVALELAQSDPPQAVRLLERQFPADIPAGVLEGVVQQWAERNYQDALAWGEALPPGARHDRVLQRLVFVRANQNPMDAAQLAQETFSDSDKRADALASIASSWGSRDPMSAREWASTLAGDARQRVDAELALLGATESFR
jgi:hypothetical protein